MANETILICDDNIAVHQSLSLYLKQEGFNVISVYDGEAVFDIVNKQHVDLIILDNMLPKLFGTEVCRRLRKTSQIPIIMLSAKGEETDIVIGLELGADDYVTKPFSPKEVVVRIKSVLRRTGASSKPSDQGIVALGNVKVNQKGYSAYIDNVEIKMTPHEIDLLYLLITHKGEVLTREYIMNSVWGTNYYGDVRSVDTLMARLRAKIPEKKSGVRFKSTYGVGYMMEESGEQT